MRHSRLSAELRGGVESSIQGLSTSIGPLLLFMGLFGASSLPAGLWATLVTASVVHAVQLLLRSNPAVIPCSRVASLAVFTGLVLQLANAAGQSQPSGVPLNLGQLQVGLMAASVLFSLASLLVLGSGLMRWGNVFKMIPTPVTSGLSNGTALLLIWLALLQVWGSAATAESGPLSISSIYAAFTGIAMVLVYLFWPKLQNRLSGLRNVTAAIMAPLAGVALIWAGQLFMGQEARPTAGAPIVWLDTEWIAVLNWSQLSAGQWGQLLIVGLPGALTLALIMVLETFMTIGIMESRFGIRVDANRELVALGGANLVSALLGGVPSTGSPIRSVSSWMQGGRGAVASVVCMAATVTLILALGHWLLELPAGIVAGLFLMQATLLLDRKFTSQLVSLLRRGRKAQHKPGSSFNHAFWLTLAITLVAFFGSLIWASFLGIAVSCLVVLRRLSGRLTARWAYLDQFRSRRMRSPVEDEALAAHAQGVAVLRLGGHLFFGNSLRLMQLGDELHPDTAAVVIDVSMVGDVDPSGCDALTWLLKDLQRRQLPTYLCGLQRSRSPELADFLKNFAGPIECLDMDRGLEQAENHLLGLAGTQTGKAKAVPIENNRLLNQLTPDELTAVLMLGELREVPQGGTLFVRDTPADGVWLLQEGRVSILATLDADATRLATFGPGQFVGEMGFIDGKPRSATGVADTQVKALLLDNNAFAALRQQHPHAVITISVNIARELSQRVRNTSSLLADRNTEESSVWDNSSLSSQSKF